MTKNERYQSVRRMVYGLVIAHVRRYGGDWQEAVQEAHLAYATAADSYDATRGAFTSWVHRHVRLRLMTLTRRRLRRRKLGDGVRLPTAVTQQDRFDLRRFIGELSEDAATVVRLVAETPGELLLGENRSTAAARQSRLAGLLAELGWAGRRVASVFQEIREALA